MNRADREAHWQKVWSDFSESETSWYQAYPETSLQMIAEAGIRSDEPIIDVGGGASLLVDYLLQAGFLDITVLDISAAALDRARQRLGQRADMARWVVSDITRLEPARCYALWHDRATFHFLTRAKHRRRYIEVLKRSLQVGGSAIIGTFAPGGPLKCSGLETRRYSADQLLTELGPGWRLEKKQFEQHRTPQGRMQKFGFYRFRRVATERS